MINILIAEDEEDIRNGIVKWVNESDTEFYVTGAAGDGISALKSVRELEPDIIVTDICMPKMGGLELIREIRRFDRDIPIIVVSGYDEFSYAREAMGMGVREYLLKPFLPGDLVEVLRKAKDVLEEKNRLAKNMRIMSEQAEEGRRFRRERFLKMVLNGRPEDAKKWGEELGFPSRDGWYCTALLMMEGEGRQAETPFLEQYLNIILENYISEGIRVMGGCPEYQQYVLLFYKHGQSRNRMQQEICCCMERICAGMERHHQIHLRCAVGRVHRGFEHLADSWQEACDLWRGRLYLEKNVIAYAEIEGQGEQADAAVEEELSNQLLMAVRRGQLADARTCLGKLMEYYTSFSIDQIDYINISLVKLVLQIQESAAGAGEEALVWKNDQILNYLKHHFTQGSLAQAKEVLENYMEQCCLQSVRMNESDGERIVDDAKAIIERNLGNEHFSLELLSEELHFSSNYVRRIFKEGTGVCFSDYLQQQRMERARELLLHSGRKIQEISELSGYSNQQYFARCFKKYYGCTPTAFREDVERTGRKRERGGQLRKINRMKTIWRVNDNVKNG